MEDTDYARNCKCQRQRPFRNEHVVERMLRNIVNMSSVTKQTAGAEQSATAAEAMSRQADGLRTVVDIFVVSESA